MLRLHSCICMPHAWKRKKKMALWILLRQAVEATISLIGNANLEAIYERRRLLLSAIHPMLVGYATRNSLNPDSDDLFGFGLQEKIRKAIDLNTDLNTFANSIPRAGKNIYGLLL